MRSLHRQPKQLIREYSGLMLAVATVDMSEQGTSGLTDWVSKRVEPLIESIKEYVASHPPVTLDRPPTPNQRFRAYHKVTIHLMGLGAQRETITEVQARVDARLLAIDLESTEGAARIPDPQKSRSSRSRSRKGDLVRFPKPPTVQ